MKSKAAIVGRLLSEDIIDAEEAVILLMEDKKDYQIPYYPSNPFNPIPWTITSTGGDTIYRSET